MVTGAWINSFTCSIVKIQISAVMLFTKPTKLLFVGDSITDCGRDYQSPMDLILARAMSPRCKLY